VSWRLVLAASLVLVAVFLIRWWLPGERPATALPTLPDTRFDYTLSDFSARFVDEQGETTLIVTGPRLEHHADTRIATLQTPRFQFEPEGRNWHGQSRVGRFERDANQLTLEGEVVLSQSLDQGQLTIETETLHHHRAARTISSDVAVSLHQPGTRARSGGLMIQLDQDTIELTNHVQAQMQTIRP
jgi:LPS export ABC transporter protein LptC